MEAARCDSRGPGARNLKTPRLNPTKHAISSVALESLMLPGSFHCGPEPLAEARVVDSKSANSATFDRALLLFSFFPHTVIRYCASIRFSF